MKWILLMSMAMSAGLSYATANVGQPAPDFTLQGSDGKTYHLADLKGKVVVLEWFNDGCPYVHKHYDSGNMQRLQKLYSGADVSWFTIASSAPGKQGHLDMDRAGKMRDEKKMANTALLLDPKSEMAKNYGAKTTPHMFVIDKKGRIAYNGAIDSDNSARPMKVDEYEKNAGIKKYLEDAINATKSGQTVAVSSTEPYGCSVKY